MSNLDGGAARATVLLVDDERKSLDLLQRTLRENYRILRAADGGEGLACLEGDSAAAVIADQRMPGMSGVEFLAESSRRFPKTQRILLTGFVEVEGLIEAINAGHVFGYVAKPWHPDDLLALVRRAVETFRLLRDNERLMADLHRKNEELRGLLDETRRLQEEKIQGERWAALGKTAGMVAHDLRSPLATIQCLAGLLEEGEIRAGSLGRSAAAIIAQVGKMKEYIDDLLMFSRPACKESSWTIHPIPVLVASLEEAFTERCRRKGILLSTELGFRGSCRINPPQVFRALENLLENAVSAAGEGGRVLISAEEGAAGEVLIRIADSGPGIPPGIRGTMFDPFVTCGKAGGTGLGLSVVDKIVREHGGRVWEETWRLNGACFHVVLPNHREGACDQ